MLKVYHYPLCPFSRAVRLILKEKNVNFSLIIEYTWNRRKEFLYMNPMCTTPILVVPNLVEFDNNNETNNKTTNKMANTQPLIVAGHWNVFQYIEDKYPEPNLLSKELKQKIHIRYVSEWFYDKFYNEVTKYIMNEKVIKTVSSSESPNSLAIRAAKKNISYHLDYISYLLGDNNYLCGEKITLADYIASAQLSCLDFVDDVPWEYNGKAKAWYALMKSRPSFKPILMDKIQGLRSPTHYYNPDF